MLNQFTNQFSVASQFSNCYKTLFKFQTGTEPEWNWQALNPNRTGIFFSSTPWLQPLQIVFNDRPNCQAVITSFNGWFFNSLLASYLTLNKALCESSFLSQQCSHEHDWMFHFLISYVLFPWSPEKCANEVLLYICSLLYFYSLSFVTVTTVPGHISMRSLFILQVCQWPVPRKMFTAFHLECMLHSLLCVLVGLSFLKFFTTYHLVPPPHHWSIFSTFAFDNCTAQSWHFKKSVQ